MPMASFSSAGPSIVAPSDSLAARLAVDLLRRLGYADAARASDWPQFGTAIVLSPDVAALAQAGRQWAQARKGRTLLLEPAENSGSINYVWPPLQIVQRRACPARWTTPEALLPGGELDLEFLTEAIEIGFAGL